MEARRAGAIAAALALSVAALWFVRARPQPAVPVREATRAIHVTRHDAYGVPSKPVIVRDRAIVDGLLDALGVGALAETACPPDYATADIGLLLTGRDVYARRNAYVWAVASAEPRVVVVDSTGCRGGPVADANALRRTLSLADAGF